MSLYRLKSERKISKKHENIHVKVDNNNIVIKLENERLQKQLKEKTPTANR
ncbi:hypothetical protein [Pseudogracilibacillus sp. SO30301A]|uniref:hypothetical protein n=1 Tax=Pseudogracilibacillus sp. SO30301A TaxID=3098291 RepID=UPI00300E3FA8